mmetsp:Transcript_61639/g.84755  ORF Transcript_61639/g.84755 Transcript_61639/m.84755 type:complete len:217 (-) Transcript_61639:695-1345(-)
MCPPSPVCIVCVSFLFYCASGWGSSDLVSSSPRRLSFLRVLRTPTMAGHPSIDCCCCSSLKLRPPRRSHLMPPHSHHCFQASLIAGGAGRIGPISDPGWWPPWNRSAVCFCCCRGAPRPLPFLCPGRRARQAQRGPASSCRAPQRPSRVLLSRERGRPPYKLCARAPLNLECKDTSCQGPTRSPQHSPHRIAHQRVLECVRLPQLPCGTCHRVADR